MKALKNNLYIIHITVYIIAGVSCNSMAETAESRRLFEEKLDQTTNVVETVLEEIGLAKDPFEPNRNEKGEGFIRAPHADIPAGIKVRGIIITEDFSPVAALEVPLHDNLILVRTNEVFSVMKPSGVKKTARSYSAERVYLKVESISSQQVEIYPQNNPAGKQVLR